MKPVLTPPSSNALSDTVLIAIALIVLLIGTATGNALALLAMALVALVVIALGWRRKLGRPVLLVGAIAFAVAFAVAMAVSAL
jgi:hypothetical protein